MHRPRNTPVVWAVSKKVRRVTATRFACADRDFPPAADYAARARAAAHGRRLVPDVAFRDAVNAPADAAAARIVLEHFR
jgi:hypothetical protein